MAYKLKTTQGFETEIKNYFQEYPIREQNERSLIENFSSENLSDLYNLFLELNGKKLDDETAKILKSIISDKYLINKEEIFGKNDETKFVVISKREIDALANIIKDVFLHKIEDNDGKINDSELYKLALIVNKNFPRVLPSLIKISPDVDIKKAQEIIEKRILKTINNWYSHNTKEAEEENRDIIGAMYIAAKKFRPDLAVYIPGRMKSTRSSINNINKEVLRSLNALMPLNTFNGLTEEEVNEQFDLYKANNDFSGFTIALDNTDDTIHFDKSDPRTKEILELRKRREENIHFSHSFENFLAENYENYFTAKEMLQMKIEILMRLRLLTYEECKKEYKGTSFENLLMENIEEYNKLDEEQEIDEYEKELDNVYELLDEMKKRVHDKYQAKILEIFVPEILEDELLKDVLHIKWRFVKKVKKENGFCADYYELLTNDGRIIELQAITKMRFKDSKDGASDHSKLPNKEISISQFFERASEECSAQNFDKMLALLKNTTIGKKNTLYATADRDLSPMDKRLKRRLRAAEQNVKLKEVYTDENGETKYTLNQYLLCFAEYISPRLMSSSSHHTRFNKGVAGYSKKSLVSAFTETLLQQDATSCLSQMLINRLEEIVPNDKNEVSRNGIIERAKTRYTNTFENKNGEEGIEL